MNDEIFSIPMECCVCLDSTLTTRLPCCKAENGHANPYCRLLFYCKKCLTKRLNKYSETASIEVLKNYRSLGQCPICMKSFCIMDNKLQKPKGKCSCLNDIYDADVILDHVDLSNDDKKNRCSACFFSDFYYDPKLKYECDRCKETAFLRYPLYRHCDGPREYSRSTFPCSIKPIIMKKKNGCFLGKEKPHTHWRLAKDELEKIKEFDWPKTWQKREHFLNLHMGILGYLYGGLLATGGIMGYVKAKSVPSLIAGCGIGLGIMYGNYAHDNGQTHGFYVENILSTLTLFMFAKKFSRSRSNMHAGIALASLGYLIAIHLKL